MSTGSYSVAENPASEDVLLQRYHIKNKKNEDSFSLYNTRATLTLLTAAALVLVGAGLNGAYDTDSDRRFKITIAGGSLSALLAILSVFSMVNEIYEIGLARRFHRDMGYEDQPVNDTLSNPLLQNEAASSNRPNL